jgi:hypothetical protein
MRLLQKHQEIKRQTQTLLFINTLHADLEKYDSSTRLASPKTRDAQLDLKGRFRFHRERGASFDWRVRNGWLACVENLTRERRENGSVFLAT